MTALQVYTLFILPVLVVGVGVGAYWLSRGFGKGPYGRRHYGR